MDCTATAPRRQAKCRKNVKPDKRLDRYKVEFVPIDSITPSPENEAIYGPIEHDEAMDNLIDSIRRKGLDQPILTTVDPDRFILSGHRRHYAAKYLDWKEVPICIARDIRREGNTEYHRELIEYNPQRVKTVGAILHEALLRDNDAADTYAAIKERREASMSVDAEFMTVVGAKDIEPIPEGQQGFLAAVQGVLEKLRPYWPTSNREIHYELASMSEPPLRWLPKRSKFDPEHYRYRNDKTSSDALERLLKSARYLGHIPMNCIDDITRPQKTWGGFDSVSHFIGQETSRFLVGYHRDRQQGQGRHIEVFGEKNTLYRKLERACGEYYVPFSLGRGFCSIPVWRDMSKRFRDSGKERMTLIIVSDYDPEGLALADDAIRSLELMDVPVDGHRIAVTREQIEELGLVEDSNPAKPDGRHLSAFIKRTGSTKTWEVEALPAEYLIEQVKAAIEANMDMKVFERVCEQEEEDCGELSSTREKLASQLEF